VGMARTGPSTTWSGFRRTRRRLLNPGVRGDLKKLFPKLLEPLPGCEIVEQNIQPDPIHTVTIIPPRYAVSDVVGRLKKETASLLRKQCDGLRRVDWRENVLWSPGYFVSTVGMDEAKIIKYVRWQERQDSGQAQLELF